ncbi:DNA cytosine methyltransferase [Shewanella sp. S23-S33]|uniref:DNA cytosine methyltransferase n=1 Tax=Shewanella sp. S23-S33 TaxID=3342769 RepID=UPI00372D5A3E
MKMRNGIKIQYATNDIVSISNDNSKFRCVDFFAGSGLVSEAIKAEFETVWANDICVKKQKVFIANHSPDVFHLDSIEKVSGLDLPIHELSWASFPCQDLSLAGNMNGIMSNRSGMVWEWLRIIDEMSQKPPIVVAENVVGLVSSKQGEHYIALHNSLLSRGYNVGAVMLDAVNWVPQSRPRVFVIGIDKNIPLDGFICDGPNWAHSKAIINVSTKVQNWMWWNLNPPTKRTVGLDELIELDLPFDTEEKVKHNISLIPENHMAKLKDAIKKGHTVFPGYKRIRNGKQVLEIRFDNVAGCLRTPSGGSSRQYLVIYRNGELGTRLLSIKETARLMGAGDTYVIPGSYNQGYKAMGDAVAVPAVRYLSKHLLSPLAKRMNEYFITNQNEMRNDYLNTVSRLDLKTNKLAG